MSTTLAHGTGRPGFVTLGKLETAQPEGSPMELTITFTNPRIAGVTMDIGSALASGCAAVLNATNHLAAIPRWNSQTPLAVAQGATLRIRWVKEAAQVEVIGAVLGGLTLAGLVAAGVVEWPLAVTIALGAGLVLLLAANWALIVNQVVHHVILPTIGGLAEPVLIVGGVGLAALVAYHLVSQV